MGAKKVSNIQKPCIYDYHDYREFLNDFFNFIKKEKNQSMRSLSKSAGLSHGYISLVIKRQRNISQKTLNKILPFINLNASEESYLKKLVALADSRSAKDRNQAFQGLKKSKNYKENHPKEFETYKYLEKWEHIAIRELALTKDFNSDPRWIKSQLPFPIRLMEIEAAIAFLVKHNFLFRDEHGDLKATERNVECLGGVFQLSLSNYHRSMLQLAQESITKYKRENRKQIGYTMAIAKDDFDEVKKIIEEAKNKIKALEQEKFEKSDTVYHVNFSAFPLAGKGVNND